jgi:chromosome segregation ATPase
MVNVKIVHQFRKLHEVEEENDKIHDRLESLQKSCDTSKQHMNKLSEAISTLEAEKAEKAAKLICLESENKSLKQEVLNLKVIYFV